MTKLLSIALAVTVIMSALCGCSTEPYVATHELSNPNAMDETAKIYDYICDNFGKTMLSCQMESTWMGSPDYEIN